MASIWIEYIGSVVGIVVVGNQKEIGATWRRKFIPHRWRKDFIAIFELNTDRSIFFRVGYVNSSGDKLVREEWLSSTRAKQFGMRIFSEDLRVFAIDESNREIPIKIVNVLYTNEDSLSKEDLPLF